MRIAISGAGIAGATLAYWLLKAGHEPVRVRRVLPEWSGDPEDLYDYAHPPTPRAGRPSLSLEGAITVTDDWPEIVPITEAELRVMEGHFAEELDAIFGPRA